MFQIHSIAQLKEKDTDIFTFLQDFPAMLRRSGQRAFRKYRERLPGWGKRVKREAGDIALKGFLCYIFK